ncbi:MAG TPA: hypothetical protein VNT51_00870 [Miltoncostaeaceae bacterium]|nr:hypothetical protein [Miltoncostaeaceae bacterium]
MRPAALVAAGVVALGAAPTALSAPACAGPADRAAAQRAAAWLAARPAAGMAPGQQADAIGALRAAGRSPAALRGRARVLARVAPGYARTPGAAGKVALATVAAGLPAGRLGGVDYLARIRRSYADGRYGASAFDQALSILALRAAGQRVPPGAVAALRGARGPGGWNFALRRGGPDAVDSTALVLEALAAAGVRRSDVHVRGALAWLARQRARDGGYAAAGGRRPSEANPTALVIRAQCALGLTPPPATRAALRRLAAADGRIRFTRASEGSALLATLDALPALAGDPLPVRTGRR